LRPPSGPGWVHEIKYDGFRMMVRRDAASVRLFTRNGHDWTERFPLIASAAAALKVRSVLFPAYRAWRRADALPGASSSNYLADARNSPLQVSGSTSLGHRPSPYAG
jgi:hypothetical protein